MEIIPGKTLPEQQMQIVECPRDAMQGWATFIPSERKIKYINSLLRVGFHTIDFGSFVSPKAIPQMADTREVLAGLNLSQTQTKLLAIVANKRGGEEAIQFSEISYLGFPFSISETFQKRNTNSTIAESLQVVTGLQNLCTNHNKKLVVYMSMGFGNPYGDAYNEDVLLKWTDAIVNTGVNIISLADTVGLATAEQISRALETLIPKYRGCTIGVHLHSTATNRKEKLNAALQAGCVRIDGALKGIGGCPMAGNSLVGNMDTAFVLDYLDSIGASQEVNRDALQESLTLASEIFQ